MTPHRVVLTGGPGAGKTAVLTVARYRLTSHVAVVPESATIIFGGGFPRYDDAQARRHAQVAIYHVQDQLEQMMLAHLTSDNQRALLCDRGVVDGLAYWPGDEETYWASVGSSRERALSRYDAVVHLRTPTEKQGYGHLNPVRTETAAQAAEIDVRIEQAWRGHPNRVIVDSSASFVTKLEQALRALETLMPGCFVDATRSIP